jgi:paraquat-inducible protein B
MTQDSSPTTFSEQTSEPVIKARKSFSIVWVVPLVAVLIGSWMVYKALSEKGSVITISFQSAEGLKAGETKIKYKDVDIGQVENIEFSPDLKHVIVTAELPRQITPYLTDNTRFWVVRARISSREVKGLGTLFGGAYIEMDPREDGKPQRTYNGLEQPPVIMTDSPGAHFNLKASELGSLNPGSPVYYRQIQVGKVESFALAANGQYIGIRIFVDHPYHQYVRKQTRFWNAGGIDLTLNADGLKVNAQPLVGILSGGLAFDNLMELEHDEPAEDGHVFKLYASYQDALQKEYTTKLYWMLDFRGSVRGLTPGAPVEFKGIRVGQVLEGNLHIGETADDIFVSVLIETEPERFVERGALLSDEERRRYYDGLVAQGLRAQLKTGSLLTGQLFVDLEFHPSAPAGRIVWDGKHPNFPTIQKTSEEVLTVINKMADKLAAFPIQKIGRDLEAIVENLMATTQQLSSGDVASILSNIDNITMRIRESDIAGMMASLNQSVAEIGLLIEKTNIAVESEFNNTLVQAQETLLAVERMLSAESSFSQGTSRALKEVADAAARIRALADYLERHPEALIRGKEN